MTPSRNSHSVLTNTLRSCRRARSSRTVSTSATTVSQRTSGLQNLGVRSVVSMGAGSSLHVGIVWAAAAFRRDPDDVLRRVLVVAGVGDKHRRQPVEGQRAIGLRIGNGFYRILAFQRLMVRLMVAQRPRRFAA